MFYTNWANTGQLQTGQPFKSAEYNLQRQFSPNNITKGKALIFYQIIPTNSLTIWYI